MINGILKKLQIKDKLIMLNLVITGIVFIIAGGISFITEYISFKESLLHSLSSQAKIVAGNSTASLAFNDQKDATEILGALRSDPEILYAVIFDAKGSEFAVYKSPGGMKIDRPIAPPKDGYLLAGNHLSIIQGIFLNGKRVGTICILSTLDKFYALMMQRGVVTLLTLLIVLAIAYLLLSKWQRVITEPILKLSQMMHRVSREKNYSLKADVNTHDEIGSLAEGFNEMLEQIQQRDMKLRGEIEERRRAEEEVRLLNEGLENKVMEKTMQLIEAQEELVRKEKLAILGQLSGCVGHELRNPLGVMNNAVFLLRSLTPHSDGTFQEYLDVLKQEIDKSERIITDLLDFSRTKTPHPEVVTVQELILNNLEGCVIPENISMEMDIPEPLPTVKVDKMQIGQVFQNLITNGIQAMPDGGAMRITVRCFPESGSEVTADNQITFETNETYDGNKGKFVEISVADSGTGISAENMKKLFQPLFTTKARGIGLGLTVCKNLTEANGGEIRVDSEPGKGTKFSILLPAGG